MGSKADVNGGSSTGREVVLFHSVLGLRPAVRRWAERLRAEGHTVHTPDLYDGRVFEDYDEGMRALESLGGIEWLIERSQAAVADLPNEVVYAGFSNGGGSAQLLALTRPGALGVVLMHAALPVEVFGAEAWPAEVPLQIHYAERDPFRDPGTVEALSDSAHRAGARCETWLYPGEGHLFADEGLAEYDERQAELMFGRVSEFLREL